MAHRSKRASGKGTHRAFATRLLRPTLAATALLALTAAHAPLQAASHRLSQGLPFSDVSFSPPPQLSPDGLYAVFVQDAVVDSAFELWSVPVNGGASVRVSGLLPSGSAIASFAISPDGQRVVFVAPQDTVGVLELYSAPIAGPEGSWTKLNPPLVAGGSVVDIGISISPDNSRVAFRADVQTDGVYDIWSVPTGGGTAFRHRPTVTPIGSGAFSGPAISPDGAHVLFLADFSVISRQELWSARLDGSGGVTRISGDLAAGEDVGDFLISPTSSWVVYRVGQGGSNHDELFSVPIGGGEATKLNPTLPGGASIADYAISPNSSRVVYLADQEVESRLELFSVAIAGGSAVKLNGDLDSGGDVYDFGISPDNSRVVYRADQQTDFVGEIYSVPLAGGAVVKLNGALASDGDVLDFAISPDSSRVVYKADQQIDGIDEIYSLPLSGGAVVRVNDPIVALGDVDSFEITADSDFVVYKADTPINNRYELYRGSILGGAAADDRLNGPIVSGGSVQANGFDFDLHPNGARALYNADQEVATRVDLYIGDPCILCDGFEGGNSLQWIDTVP